MIITLIFCSLYNSYVRLGDCILVLYRTPCLIQAAARTVAARWRLNLGVLSGRYRGRGRSPCRPGRPRPALLSGGGPGSAFRPRYVPASLSRPS